MPTIAEMKQAAIAAIEERKEELIATAKTILDNPETGFTEQKTSRLVQQRFEAMGIPHQAGLAITGSVAQAVTSAASAASKALPPARKIPSAAPAVNGCPAATIPFVVPSLAPMISPSPEDGAISGQICQGRAAIMRRLPCPSTV
ncbi:MAG: hypothetical protein IIB33_03595 [Chloroflexi bacterium]|nr:hypothetical protein [Chloroflexota bacterium]